MGRAGAPGTAAPAPQPRCPRRPHPPGRQPGLLPPVAIRAAAARRVARRHRRAARAAPRAARSRRRGPARARRSASARRTVDSRWAMTNDVRFAHQVRQRVLHELLRLGVERRGRLVENQDRRVLEQRARDRQALALPARQPLAALADDASRTRPASPTMNSCACAARAAASICVRGRRRGDPYAMLFAIVSSKSTVSCVTIPICARSDASVTSRMSDAVDQDRPARHVVEPRDQVDERRLARAAAPDDAPPSGRRRTVNDTSRRIRRRPVVVVVEADVAELDRPARSGASGRAPGRSCTSVCVSSISKIRSEAAIVCWRFAFTRLSFFTGPYIRNSAAMNDVNSPAVSGARHDLAAAVPERRRHRRRRRAVP